MPSKRGRPRIEDAKVEAFIREKVPLEWTPTQIEHFLTTEPDFAGCTIPANMRRTVGYYRVADLGDPWTVAKADPLQAALVLPVLGAAMKRAAGRLSGITVGQAKLIATIRAGVPDLDVWRVWQIMAAYMLAKERERPEDTASLDALLALTPWRSAEAMAQFVRTWLFEERVVGAGELPQGPPVRIRGLSIPADAIAPGVKTAAEVAPAGVVLKPIRGRERTVGYLIALEIEKESQHD